jgi:hypothetical protein
MEVVLIQRLGGNLNELVAERPTQPGPTGARTGVMYRDETRLAASSCSAGVTPSQPGVGGTPRSPGRPAGWLLDTNVALSDSFAAGGGYLLTTPVREAFEFDFDIFTTEGASSKLLRQTELQNTVRRKIRPSEGSISGNAPYEGSTLVPYLALVRSALDRDDLNTARRTLDAVPLDIADLPEVRRLKSLLAAPRITVSATRDVDRTREYEWFRHHWQDYRAQWVALDGDTVLAAAASLKELRETLRRMNLARPPLVHRID